MSGKRKRKKQRYLKNKQNKIMKKLRWRNRHQRKVRHIFHNREFESGEGILKYLSKKKFIKHKIVWKLKSITNSSLKNKNIVVPEVFSFTKEPEETIRTLQSIADIAFDNHIRSVFIDHSKCNVLDICASTVMDVLILAIKDKNRNRSYKIHGQLSQNKKVNEILIASGIKKHLHLSESDIPGVECLPLLHNESSSKMAQSILEYLTRCLNSQSFSLKLEGRNKIAEMLSEVIDNCSQHAKFHEWFALGHYSKDRPCQGKVRLVIFNFGHTIYESFMDVKSEKKMYEYLKNKAKRLRDVYPDAPSEETLITLYALQDGISRFNHQDHQCDRGSGTIKLINIFQLIGRKSNPKDKTAKSCLMSAEIPTMSITSGHTHILFDKKYHMQLVDLQGSKKYIIAFNEENSLELPPDPANVHDLNVNFPGTVISMEFFIDRGFLSDAIQGGGH